MVASLTLRIMEGLPVTRDESRKVGIRLTQGMPASCGRADLIPAGPTVYCGHLSEADTHLSQIGAANSPKGDFCTSLAEPGPRVACQGPDAVPR